MRVPSAVHGVVDELLAHIRPWPPLEGAAAQTELVLFFILEGCGALGESAPEAVVAAYAGLFGVLNGFLWEPQLFHYCRGRECCPEGRVSAHKNIVEGLLAGPLRARPVVPQLTRWAKSTACLEFFLQGLAIHGVLLQCIVYGLLQRTARVVDTTAAGLGAIPLQIDPGALADSEVGYKSLKGVRLKRTFQCLSNASTLCLFWVSVATLGALRYVQRYLQSSVRSVRVRARASGHEREPPSLDLSNKEWSPVHLASTFVSNVCAGGLRRATTLFNILRRTTAEGGRLGSWKLAEL